MVYFRTRSQLKLYMMTPFMLCQLVPQFQGWQGSICLPQPNENPGLELSGFSSCFVNSCVASFDQTTPA
ncbi:hypothetical protein SLA2020_366360 [Shorea laevis]